MSAVLMDGPLSMTLQRDDNGYRTYSLKLLIRLTDLDDGPSIASNCPGLPLPGDPWLVDNDLDIWVWCRPEASITRHTDYDEGHPVHFYIGEFTFSNKPLTREQAEKRRGCHEQQIEDPLLEPDRTSGGFQKKAKEATHDRFGLPILNSAFEVVRGPQVEFDESRPTVKVVQNRPLLQFDLLCFLIDCLNDTPLWGFPARWVKFSNCTWEEQYHGLCYRYYVRTLEFEIREDWDRNLLDEGSKVLNGHWGDGEAEGDGWVLDKIGGASPDPNNPSHFIRAIDRKQDPMRIILDGEGRPATSQAIKISTIIEPEFPSTTAEVQTEIVHGLTAGDTVWLEGVDPPYYDGEYTVLAVLTTTSFTITVFEDAEDYSEGGYVITDGTGPGNIRVEKFRSANFLLLGIPLVIGH